MKKQKIRGILAAVTFGILSVFTLTAQAASERWTSTTSRDADNNICVSFRDVQVLLPESWSGICQMGTSENSAAFYQTKSRQLWTDELGYANGGWLFSINFSQDDSYTDNPSYMTIGYTPEGTYYATFPTDLQAYTEDTEAYNEFISMSNDIAWIKSHITLTAEGSTAASDGDYIFPQSSSAYLSQSDLDGMNADQIQMAINEIYARHNRKFVIQSIQDYFNSKSWYSGTVEAEDFDVSVMNEYEGANIALMVERLNSVSSSSQTAAEQSGGTADAYGMIIESGDGYFRLRLEDGSIVQLWYDGAKLGDMGLNADAFTVGAIASVIYDTESYEAVNILVW